MADFSYEIDKRLILVPVTLRSPTGTVRARFVLDTGASFTIVDYRIAETIGYEPHHAVAPSRVSSASGKEQGFRIKVASFETLGKRMENFEVACHSLLEQGVEGLVGMNFLEQFEYNSEYGITPPSRFSPDFAVDPRRILFHRRWCRRIVGGGWCIRKGFAWDRFWEWG